jgi:hypothetical protein
VAKAMPGLAIAVPIPNAIARAPVRPIYRAYRVLTLFGDGVPILASIAACLPRPDPFAVRML